MKGWTVGWVDGLMSVWTDERMDSWMDGGKVGGWMMEGGKEREKVGDRSGGMMGG